MNPFIRDSTAITIKELKQLRRDPVSLLLTILFPILLIGNFIVIGGALRETTHNIPVVVADLDGSGVSKQLLDKLTSSALIRVNQVLKTQEQAFQIMSSGQVVGAVVIPQGFGQGLAQGHAFIVVQTDNSKPSSATLMVREVRNQIRIMLKQFALGELGTAFEAQVASVNVITIPNSGRPPTGDPYLPGFLGMIAILGAFDDIVNAINRERERGTFPRLVLTPISMLAIYSGKMSATIILTVLRTSLMLIILSLNGLVIRGNLILIFLTTILIAMFTLSLGLVLSSKIHSSSTLTVLEIAMTFPLFSLAGIGTSPLLLAPAGRAIALSLPWSYGSDALRRIIYLGLGLNAIWSDLFILLVSSIILVPVAIKLSSRTM